MIEYVYLLQEREFIKSKEPIYKIGKTKQIGLKRFNQYPKNSILHFHISCINCDIMENKIIKLFDTKYIKRKDIGSEYYEGNYVNMIDDIYLLFKSLKFSDIKNPEDIKTEPKIPKLKIKIPKEKSPKIKILKYPEEIIPEEIIPEEIIPEEIIPEEIIPEEIKYIETKFLENYLISIDKENKIKAFELYNLYKLFCIEENHKCINNSIHFGRKINRYEGIEVKKGNKGNFYIINKDILNNFKKKDIKIMKLIKKEQKNNQEYKDKKILNTQKWLIKKKLKEVNLDPETIIKLFNNSN